MKHQPRDGLATGVPLPKHPPPRGLETLDPTRALMGDRKAGGLTMRGPSKPADKHWLTMDLSVRGSPNWFVSGRDLPGRG